MAIDYAAAYGFKSLAAAIVFSILYAILLGFFISYSIRNRTYVLFMLSFFCAIRVTAFAIRAALIKNGTNLNLLIGDEVLSGIGFFGLLYSAYTLVLDRIEISDSPVSTSPISRITQNRRVFRLALTAAVALGIAGVNLITSSNASSRSTGNALHKASTIMFLVLTVLQVYQTVVFTIHNHSSGQYKAGEGKWGDRHASHALCLISLLLLVREVFLTATISNATKQNNEHFWYPLLAVPEILAVILYAIPGLVPSHSKLPK